MPPSAHAATIAFDALSYAYNSAPAIITVTDPAADTTPDPDTVTVTVTSDSDLVGITLQLTETGGSTGVFQNTALIFMDGNNLITVDTTITVTYDDPTIAGSGSFDALASSTFPPDFGITNRGQIDPFTMTETSPGTFESLLTLTSTGPTTATDLEAVGGDIISAFFFCETSNGLMIPNPDSTVGAIFANVDDTVTVEYDDAGVTIDDTATILSEGGCGGSGGGLVISTVVLEFIGSGGSDDTTPPQVAFTRAAISNLLLAKEFMEFILNADPFTPLTTLTDPTIDYPFSINDNGYLLSQYANTIETYTANTGEPLSFGFHLFDETGIEHIALYTNLRGNAREVHDSDTYIIYDEGKPLEIVDPHGYFYYVNYTESQYGREYEFEFDIVFAKPMDTSDIILRVWDQKRNGGDTKIFDAIKVEGGVLTSKTETDSYHTQADSVTLPYYLLLKDALPVLDEEGYVVYYNGFGDVEKKKVRPYFEPIIYGDTVGRMERNDDGFKQIIITESARAEDLASIMSVNPFIETNDAKAEKHFYYPSYLGKLDRENITDVKEASQKENEKALELYLKLYSTNHLLD